MSDSNQHRRIMENIWDKLHDSSSKMPPDLLILEGDHDLIYLYNSGFVDTDKFSLEKWIQAFKLSKQAKGAYHLTKSQWLEKVSYRYNELVPPPFNPLRLRSGVWTVTQLKQFAKDVIIPETILTYEQYLKGLREAERKGDIKDGQVTIDDAWKQKLKKLLEDFPSPQRRRALAVQKARRREEMEDASSTAAPYASTAPTAAAAPKSAYEQKPDQRKQMSNQLADLLSGGKK